MSTKKICDACGNDMTEDPATGRLTFVCEQDSLRARQTTRVWPNAIAIKVSVESVRLDRSSLGDLSHAWTASDVCSSCVKRAVAEGFADDAGPVTR